MEVQPYLMQRVLYVTTRGEASGRVAICVHESDTIAEVRVAVQHALRAVPDFPQEVTITSIECEYEGEDYVLSDPIQVNQIFGTGTAKLKVQVGSSRGGGQQRPMIRDMSPCRTIARSPASFPFLTRTSPRTKQNTVARVFADEDVEMTGNSNSHQTVARVSADDEGEVIGNAFSHLVSVANEQTVALGSLTHLSACPSLQRETTTSEPLEKGRNSVLDVTKFTLQEPAGEPDCPIVMSVDEDPHEEPEQGIRDGDLARQKQCNVISKPQKNGNQDVGSTPQKEGNQDVGGAPQKQENQDVGSTPQKRGTENVSGTGNQDLGWTSQEQGSPRGENVPSKSPQKLIRFRFAAVSPRKPEHQASAVKPTGSQDTDGSGETSSRPYRRPSPLKRKLGAEVHGLLGDSINGGPCSTSSRRRSSKGDHISTAMQSLEQEPTITLNATDKLAEESNGIRTEALDTAVATEECRQETADGKRSKKKKSKRSKGTVDEQPVSNQEPEYAIGTLRDPGPGSVDHIEDYLGKEGRLMDEAPPQDTQASHGLNDGEEHRVDIVPKTFAPNDTNGGGESELPESTPTSKRRRPTKKRKIDVAAESPLAQALCLSREDSTREGPKVALFAFIAEEHLPKTSEVPEAGIQLDTTGGVASNTEQGHVPEIVEDGRLAGTPVRSSPRLVKKPVVETAIGNKEGAPQENCEKQSVESDDENNRTVENPTKKKRQSGRRQKKRELVRSRIMEGLRKEIEQELSDSHAYAPNDLSTVANEVEDLSDGANGGLVTPRNRKMRKDKDNPTENKLVADGDQARVPCRYMRLGCQKDYLYKTSAYYLHCRYCVYKGDCPSP